jgi:hypothetical protein
VKIEHRKTGSAEIQASVERPEFGKARETKEDGRYIVFYTFEDEEASNARPDEEGEG